MSEPSRSDLAYHALKQAIIEQALRPGTKLPEDVLGAQFAVSRTLVRDALARLIAEGLVEAGHKRTATVARPTREDARHVFEVRGCLERETVSLLASRWTSQMAALLDAHVKQEESAARDQPAAVSGRLAGEFHLKLAQLTGNPLLERYTSELVSRCSLILAVHGRPHEPECSIGEHRGLIAALRRGDAEAAVHAMDEHLAAVQTRALPPETDATAADLGSILGRYASAVGSTPAVGAPSSVPSARSRNPSRRSPR